MAKLTYVGAAEKVGSGVVVDEADIAVTSLVETLKNSLAAEKLLLTEMNLKWRRDGKLENRCLGQDKNVLKVVVFLSFSSTFLLFT